MKIEEYLIDNPSMIEDLRIASQLLAKSRPIVADALRRYANDFGKYDPYQRKPFESPFEK